MYTKGSTIMTAPMMSGRWASEIRGRLRRVPEAVSEPGVGDLIAIIGNPSGESELDEGEQQDCDEKQAGDSSSWSDR